MEVIISSSDFRQVAFVMVKGGSTHGSEGTERLGKLGTWQNRWEGRV